MTISSIRCALFIIAQAASGATALSAQRRDGSAEHTVLRLSIDDSLTGLPVSGARVELTSLSRSVRSDGNGRVQFADVPVGFQRIHIWAIGYQPVNRLLNIGRAESGDSTATMMDLSHVPAVLDSVRTTASRTETADGGGFETRRRLGIGHFLTQDEFDRDWSSKLSAIIATHIPGIRDDGGTLVSTRGDIVTRGTLGPCALEVYIDGVRVTLFHLNDIDPTEIAAAEIYTTTNIPPRFKSTGGHPECGVLLLWYRQ